MTKNDLIKVRVSLLEYARHTGFEATESLRIIDEELAAEPQQPYAYERDGSFIPAWHCTEPPPGWVALFAAPPSREWQGLTEDDIFDEWGNCQPIDHGFPERYAKALDAALKEKNA